MRNIKLLLTYDGSNYHGWERQVQERTLQQTLEDAIQSLTGEAVRVLASGRTDAGVHALGQIANFRTSTRHDCDTIRRALNALLPDDFRVIDAADADIDFHATYAAKGKLYRYALCDGPVVDPFLRRYVVQSNWQLDTEAMHQAAQSLAGTHDFSSFETAGAPRESSVRTICNIAVFRAGPERIWSCARMDLDEGGRWSEDRGQKADRRDHGAAAGNPQFSDNPQSAIRNPQLSDNPQSAIRNPQFLPPLIFLEVSADGFLYNMVRAIAGTLINVGRGYWPVAAVQQILHARDRTQAGPTAPPHGLFLVCVDY